MSEQLFTTPSLHKRGTVSQEQRKITSPLHHKKPTWHQPNKMNLLFEQYPNETHASTSNLGFVRNVSILPYFRDLLFVWKAFKITTYTADPYMQDKALRSPAPPLQVTAKTPCRNRTQAYFQVRTAQS